MLAPELVLSVAWRFGQVHLDTFSWEFRADFQAHSLWPETVYVRSNGNIVGWFEEPFGQDPSIVEIPADKSLPFYLWPDRAVFLSDFLAKEGQFPQQQLLDILVARGVIPPSFGSASSQELKGKEHG